MIAIDFEKLHRIGLTQTTIHQLYSLNPLPGDGIRLLRITAVQRDCVSLHDGDAELSARVLPALRHQLELDDASLTVGDWVLVETHPGNEPWLAARLAPTTHLARRANDGRRQALASNIDTALLVMGLDLDFNLRRLERYIALVQASGVAAVVVLTKVDIGDDVQERMAQVRERLPCSVPVFALNALEADSCQQLAPWLGTGQTLVLLGSSGTGKSTLTNTLTGAGQQTGAVRSSDGRGQHTTTARTLHFCTDGACIIDTPGLRTWRPDADEETLAATFEDIEALAGHCQFRNCRHEEEPGCAVRENVDADRLLNYHKLLRDVRRSQQTPLERIALRAKWKKLAKAGGARVREKRG